MVSCACPTIQTSKKNLILDVGMEKEEKQELGWRVSVLPNPAFHCILNYIVPHFKGTALVNIQ